MSYHSLLCLSRLAQIRREAATAHLVAQAGQSLWLNHRGYRSPGWASADGLGSSTAATTTQMGAKEGQLMVLWAPQGLT
jgi:hypothetical protein